MSHEGFCVGGPLDGRLREAPVHRRQEDRIMALDVSEVDPLPDPYRGFYRWENATGRWLFLVELPNEWEFSDLRDRPVDPVGFPQATGVVRFIPSYRDL